MNKIKLGIIGLGNMGSGHAQNVKGGKCPDIELVAVADINPDRIKWGRENLPEGITYFDDAVEMLALRPPQICNRVYEKRYSCYG